MQADPILPSGICEDFYGGFCPLGEGCSRTHVEHTRNSVSTAQISVGANSSPPVDAPPAVEVQPQTTVQPNSVEAGTGVLSSAEIQQVEKLDVSEGAPVKDDVEASRTNKHAEVEEKEGDTEEKNEGKPKRKICIAFQNGYCEGGPGCTLWHPDFSVDNVPLAQNGQGTGKSVKGKESAEVASGKGSSNVKVPGNNGNSSVGLSASNNASKSSSEDKLVAVLRRVKVGASRKPKPLPVRMDEDLDVDMLPSEPDEPGAASQDSPTKRLSSEVADEKPSKVDESKRSKRICNPRASEGTDKLDGPDSRPPRATSSGTGFRKIKDLGDGERKKTNDDGDVDMSPALSKDGNVPQKAGEAARTKHNYADVSDGLNLPRRSGSDRSYSEHWSDMTRRDERRDDMNGRRRGSRRVETDANRGNQGGTHTVSMKRANDDRGRGQGRGRGRGRGKSYDVPVPKVKYPAHVQNQWYCKVCEKDCNSESNYNSHIAGKNHKRKTRSMQHRQANEELERSYARSDPSINIPFNDTNDNEGASDPVAIATNNLQSSLTSSSGAQAQNRGVRQTPPNLSSSSVSRSQSRLDPRAADRDVSRDRQASAPPPNRSPSSVARSKSRRDTRTENREISRDREATVPPVRSFPNVPRSQPLRDIRSEDRAGRREPESNSNHTEVPRHSAATNMLHPERNSENSDNPRRENLRPNVSGRRGREVEAPLQCSTANNSHYDSGTFSQGDPIAIRSRSVSEETNGLWEQTRMSAEPSLEAPVQNEADNLVGAHMEVQNHPPPPPQLAFPELNCPEKSMRMTVHHWRALREHAYRNSDEERLAYKVVQEFLLSPNIGIGFQHLAPFNKLMEKVPHYVSGQHIGCRWADFHPKLVADPETDASLERYGSLPEDMEKAAEVVGDNIDYQFWRAERKENDDAFTKGEHLDATKVPPRGRFGTGEKLDNVRVKVDDVQEDGLFMHFTHMEHQSTSM